MPRKPKFNPEITWVKLNPEQAVMFCQCYSVSRYLDGFQFLDTAAQFVCQGASRSLTDPCRTRVTHGASSS